MLLINLIVSHFLILVANCLYIPLTYYCEKNLPFGFQTEISGSQTYKNGTEV